MNIDLKKEIEDVSTSYDLLEDGLNNLENKIWQEYIPDISKKGQLNEIKKTIEFVEKIENNKSEVLKLKNLYNEIVVDDSDEEREECEEENERDIKDVVDRTTWSKENDSIRIVTTRPDNSSTYPNVIPISIFNEIVKTIVDQFCRYNKEYIKTSTISSLMNDKIINETNYKKSPKTVVYTVIKVLIKENVLQNKENYKRMYVLNKSRDYILNWIENI